MEDSFEVAVDSTVVVEGNTEVAVVGIAGTGVGRQVVVETVVVDRLEAAVDTGVGKAAGTAEEPVEIVGEAAEVAVERDHLIGGRTSRYCCSYGFSPA